MAVWFMIFKNVNPHSDLDPEESYPKCSPAPTAHDDVPSSKLSLVTKGSTAHGIWSSNFVGELNPCCDFDLENSNLILLHDTLPCGSAMHKIWLQMVTGFRRYCRVKKQQQTDEQTDRWARQSNITPWPTLPPHPPPNQNNNE